MQSRFFFSPGYKKLPEVSNNYIAVTEDYFETEFVLDIKCEAVEFPFIFKQTPYTFWTFKRKFGFPYFPKFYIKIVNSKSLNYDLLFMDDYFGRLVSVVHDPFIYSV
jgi:hypothetical protein